MTLAFRCCAFLVALLAVALPVGLAWLLSEYSPTAWNFQETETYKFDFAEGYAPFKPGFGWAPIPRIPLAELTPERFQNEFLLKRRPLIISDVKEGRAFTFSEIVQDCRDMPLNFGTRFLQPLQSIPEWLHPYFDWYLAKSYGEDAGVTIRAIIEQRMKRWTLATWVEALRSSKMMAARPRVHTWLADYIWPLSVPGNTLLGIRKACPSLWEATKSQVMELFKGLTTREFGSYKMEWDLYLAAAGSRAFPLHQHGRINENFLMVLAGAKRAVIFPPSEEQRLYERPEFSSEFGDRLFIGQGLSNGTMPPDFQVYPLVKEARGAEGDVQAGEVMYLPANVIHEIENLEDTVATAVHVGASSTAFGDNFGAHIEEAFIHSQFDALRRRPGFSSGFGWRLLRSLPSRWFL